MEEFGIIRFAHPSEIKKCLTQFCKALSKFFILHISINIYLKNFNFWFTSLGLFFKKIETLLTFEGKPFTSGLNPDKKKQNFFTYFYKYF